MISVIVQQQPADFQGPDIVDQMIATQAMALRRGSSAISRDHLDRRRISGTCGLRQYMRPGSIILYTDRAGEQHRCLLLQSPGTINRDGGSFTATTNLVMEHKTERKR